MVMELCKFLRDVSVNIKFQGNIRIVFWVTLNHISSSKGNMRKGKKSAAFLEITHVYLKNTITTKKLENTKQKLKSKHLSVGQTGNDTLFNKCI